MSAMDPFEAIQPLLVDAIPRAIAALDMDDPLCIVRVYYYDTHAPCAYVDFRFVSAQARQRILDEKGKNGLFYLWGSGEEAGIRPSITIPADCLETEGQLSRLLAMIYALLGQNEDLYMRSYRAALQAVTRELNAKDWSEICPVSDDFVIVPADGSQHFANEHDDLVQGIPPERLELLRSRGFFGPEPHWDRRPGYDDGQEAEGAREAEIEQRALGMPAPDRVAYWIDQLDHLAAGDDCDVKRVGANARYPLDHLAQMGHQVVAPLLRFALRWADQPEWDVDDEEAAEALPMANVLLLLLWKVQEMGYADREIELLLREFLARSCRANAGRALWGTLPVHCADTLHKLFGRYPEPTMADNNALVDAERFLAIDPPKRMWN